MSTSKGTVSEGTPCPSMPRAWQAVMAKALAISQAMRCGRRVLGR